MDEEKPISRFAHRFVTRKLEQISRSAYDGSEGQREYENNFVDGVLELTERIRRPDLRRHVMNEAEKSSEYLRQVKQSLEGAIRKVVWNGPWVETDEGRTIRGAVGQTHQGEYRYAEVSLYQEHGPTGRVSFSVETPHWNEKLYAHKEQAIFASRETVQRSVERDRRAEQSVEPQRQSSAEKYGGQDASSSEIKPPSRAR
jgi:hypothetical protein